MNPSPLLRRSGLLLLLALGAGCPKPPDQRAFEVCRRETGRHLVEPATAVYERLRVEKRSNDGASVVDGWDVELSVVALAGDRKTKARSFVKCTLGQELELLDLTGEQVKPE